MRKIIGTAAVVGVLALAGCASQAAPRPAAVSTGAASAAAPATPAAVPSVAPSPDGTYQGACDYSLAMSGDNLVSTATGDIQTKNTGNIGTMVRLRITWPQQGYAPLKMIRTVRLHPGQSKDVQFHMPLTQTQITDLQNWQSGHGEKDGCTYRGTITSTFGSAR